MQPYLDIGSLPLSTYALAAVVGYLACVAVATRLGQKDGLEPRRLVDLTFWILIFVIVGARLGYLVEMAPFYFEFCAGAGAERPFLCDDLLLPWRGGFAFFGGLLAGLGGLFLLVRRYELPLYRTADAIIPGVALAHGIGRIGCLLGGCCYGEETTLPWGITFPMESLAAGAARHPTQILEAGFEIALFAFLWWRFGRRRYHGQLLVLYLVLYPAARFLVEMLRGDEQRGYVVEIAWPWLMTLLGSAPEAPPFLSWPQTICLALIAGALLLHRKLKHGERIEGNQEVTSR